MSEHNASQVRLKPIVAAAQAEVALLFRERETSKLHYHSHEHTREVVEAADQIANLSGFSESDHEAILLAAWWHDTGMLLCGDDPVGHEKTSTEQVNLFLKKHNYPQDRTELIDKLIMATDMSHTPATDLEKAMRDADMNGLGRPEYRDRLKSLRKEWAAQGRLHTTDRVQWLQENIAFFNSHSYLTPAAERLFGEQKEQNLKRLEKQLAKREKQKSKSSKKKDKTSKESSADKSAIQSEKSAQMMLKTTLRNNINLTSIADGKANIMLSINAVILTVAVPLIGTYIPTYNYLMMPTAVLLLTSVISITYATLATRPVKTSGSTDLSQIGTGKTNLFFFGNYHSMNIADYKSGLKKVLASQDILDSAVMNDLYWLGVALGRKFNRLRICYAVFLAGMVLSVVSFIIAYAFA
ncbi:MAG: Pycsar system effector family protein [Saprospiraceae bacterium]